MGGVWREPIPRELDFLYVNDILPSVQLQRRLEKFLANAADDDQVY